MELLKVGIALYYQKEPKYYYKFPYKRRSLLRGRNLKEREKRIAERYNNKVKLPMIPFLLKMPSKMDLFPAIENVFVCQGDQPMLKKSPHNTVATSTKKSLQEGHQLLPHLGQLVSMIFWGDHINQDVLRGPFINGNDCICARFTLVLNDQERIIKTSEDEDDIEAQDAKRHG